MHPGTPHPTAILRELAVLRHSFSGGRRFGEQWSYLFILPTHCHAVPTGAGCTCRPLQVFVAPASCRPPFFLQLSTINSALPTPNTHPPCLHTLTHSPLTTQNIAPVFSCTYKLLLPQTTHFDNLTNCRGCHPIGAAKKAISVLRTIINFSSFILLHALLRASNIQLPCFQPLPHSFTKTPGWGVCSIKS